jgi:ppGpp synthetase/RelA/SpoT-type nucleotidyltranferase
MVSSAPDFSKHLAAFDSQTHELNVFMEGVFKWFGSHPKLTAIDSSVIHSVKMRLKDRNHLRVKLQRMLDLGKVVPPDELFVRITDLAGVRVLHLYQDQFPNIHDEIMQKVDGLGDWYLDDNPKAYSWDPESSQFFQSLGIDVQIKDSFYTSVHYLVRPRKDSPLCCEIQVRNLFEEIWGEVDHILDYPHKAAPQACREQLRVLAKLVGAGSRLVDSIFRSAHPAGKAVPVVEMKE